MSKFLNKYRGTWGIEPLNTEHTFPLARRCPDCGGELLGTEYYFGEFTDYVEFCPNCSGNFDNDEINTFLN